MSLLVDTSVWSLALRRDGAQDAPEVMALHTALLGADQACADFRHILGAKGGAGDHPGDQSQRAGPQGRHVQTA